MSRAYPPSKGGTARAACKKGRDAGRLQHGNSASLSLLLEARGAKGPSAPRGREEFVFARCFVPEGFAPARAVSPVPPVTAYLSTARYLPESRHQGTRGDREATGTCPAQRFLCWTTALDSPHIASSLAPGTRDADGLEPSGGVLDHGGPRSSALAFLEGHDEHETVSFCSRAELSNALGPAAPLRGWGRRGSSEQLDGM